MVKVTVSSRGSLFHYAHFLCDVLFPEINLRFFEKGPVYRQKILKQTLGKFSIIYEDVMRIKNIELSEKDFEKKKDSELSIKRSDDPNIEDFDFFQHFMFNRYNITRDDSYPEIILIERGERVELLDDEELMKKNKNYRNGKERREIKDLDKLKNFMDLNYQDRYKTLILEKVDFKEQIKYFFNAKMVIAVHGAALSNLLFSTPYTKVIEVNGERQWAFFDKISEKLRLIHLKCDNNLDDIQRMIKEMDTTEIPLLKIYDDLNMKIIDRRLEQSKIPQKLSIPVPTIYYIGMEKTGSKSLLNGFPDHLVAHWHSTEYFEYIYKNYQLSKNDLDLYDFVINLGERYHFKPLIIESIREPIAQIISAIVQHLKKRETNNCQCQYCLGYGFTEEFLRVVKKNINANNWLNYPRYGFQSIKMWKKHFNINLLDVFKSKNCYYDLPMAKLLLIRLEDSEDREKLFSKIGYRYKETFANQSETNEKVSEIYGYIKNNLRFSDKEMKKIYKDEVKIFYSKSEIDSFKDTWRKKID